MHTHAHSHLCAKTEYCSPVALYLKKFLSSTLSGVQNHLLLCRVPVIFKTTVKAAAPTIALVSCYSSASNRFKAYHKALWARHPPCPIPGPSMPLWHPASTWRVHFLFLLQAVFSTFHIRKTVNAPVPPCLQVTFVDDWLSPSICPFCLVQNSLCIWITSFFNQD